MLLRNSLTLNCKTVEILEDDEAEESRDVIRLNEPWSVQEKPLKNRGRYIFEVRMEDGSNGRNVSQERMDRKVEESLRISELGFAGVCVCDIY